MATDGQRPIIPISSSEVRKFLDEVWDEAKPVAESLPQSKTSFVARFFPTDTCIATIDRIINEYPRKELSSIDSTHSTRKIKKIRRGGLVVFPSTIPTAEPLTVIQPLHVSGEVRLGDTFIDRDHYYYVLKQSEIYVPQGGKLVILVLSNFEYE